MAISTTRELLVLGAAACVPLALGIATHLEHLETQRACLAEVCAEHEVASPREPAAPIAIVVPTPVLIEPEPGDLRGAYDFAFVVELPTPHIVLASEDELGVAAFAALAISGPAYRGARPDDRFDHPVWRDVDAERLPERARLAAGREVRVYAAAGQTCVARIGQPVLVSEMAGTLEYVVEGVTDDEDDAMAIDDGFVADPASIWGAGRRLVVAPLHGDGCADALWARDVALAEPLVYVPRIVETIADLPSAAARREVQRSAALRPIAAAFARHAAQLGVERKARRLVDRLEGQMWLEPRRATELAVFAAVGEEFGGCGGFDASWAAVAVDADAKPVGPVWADATTDWIEAVFDLDADGTPEVMAQTRLGTRRVFRLDDGLRELATLGEAPTYGCPC